MRCSQSRRNPLNRPPCLSLAMSWQDQTTHTSLARSLSSGKTPSRERKRPFVAAYRNGKPYKKPASAASPSSNPAQRETDPRRLAQRQKQIDFGKNTIGYARYIAEVPREKRTKNHPRTPDKYQVISKRAFDAQIRSWRRALHQWDPEYVEGLEEAQDGTAEKDLSSLDSSFCSSVAGSEHAEEEMVIETPPEEGSLEEEEEEKAVPVQNENVAPVRQKKLWCDIVEEEERALAAGHAIYSDPEFEFPN